MWVEDQPARGRFLFSFKCAHQSRPVQTCCSFLAFSAEALSRPYWEGRAVSSVYTEPFPRPPVSDSTKTQGAM